MSIIESELGGPTVFKDLSKLDFDYVPRDLPHREEALRNLTRTFRGLATSGQRENLLITGPVGCGKTALVKRFGQDLSLYLHKQGKRLDVAYVNCRSRKTAGLAALGILNHFEPHYPERGFGIGEMLGDLRKHLERKDAHLMVILDEVDALIRADGSDLVYDLTRFTGESGPSWNAVSLILVSQHQDVLEQLDDAARSTFKSNVMRLEGYELDALEAITTQRVELAFNPGTVDPDTQLLVADIARDSGNARQVIEILQKAGIMADDERSEIVTPEFVRAAKAEVYSYITTSKLQQLQPHPRLVLLALARALRKEESAYVTTGALETGYQLLCEELEEKPRAHTQFWKYLKQLQDAGLIIARISGKGQQGTTQHISIPDAPAKVLEQKLLDMRE